MFTIICNFWKFFLFSKNMEYYMQFQEFLSLFQKRGLSYAIVGISFPSPETWTFVCNLLEFLYLLQKRGLSYIIYGISFSSPKIWTIICNINNFYPFPKTWTIICNFGNFFPFYINMNYHMQVSRIPFSYP